MLGKGRGPWVVKFGPMLGNGGGPSMRGVRCVRGVVCVVWWALCALRDVRGVCDVRPSAPTSALTHTLEQCFRNGLVGHHQGYSKRRRDQCPTSSVKWDRRLSHAASPFRPIVMPTSRDELAKQLTSGIVLTNGWFEPTLCWVVIPGHRASPFG